VLLRIAVSEHASSNVLYERMCALDGLSAADSRDLKHRHGDSEQPRARCHSGRRAELPGTRRPCNRVGAVGRDPTGSGPQTATMQANLLAEANRVFDMVLAERTANG